MEQSKKYPAILLPANEASNLYFDFIEKKLFYCNQLQNNNTAFPCQHIYLIDPLAEIKQNTICYDTFTKGLIYYNPLNLHNNWNGATTITLYPHFKAVIASTDKQLFPNSWIDISKSMWLIDIYNKYGRMPEVVSLEIADQEYGFISDRVVFEGQAMIRNDGSVCIIEPVEKPTMEETK